ncbi:MAG: cytochrome c [Crocinitomicaceae bacterium]|nr:cytochrome c [Crocinitomicaceae bacterium]
MHPNITKIIDQYLSNELSQEDKIAFEKKVESNRELQQEVELQKSILEGIKRAGQRSEVKKASKQYHRIKLLKWGMISLSSILAIVSIGYVLTTTLSNTEESITTELSELLNPKAQIENLAIQYFNIDQEGGLKMSKEGVLISVPKKAFLLNGKPYSGASVIQFQEALKASSIVKSGLSTMSGDRLLETQGMFGVTGFTPEGEELELNPDVGVYIQVPVDEYKTGMQLFDGVKDENGNIDWQNPKPLAKIPVPVDMSELDFYPEEYEPHLDQIKWEDNKVSRDSLYLSFELRTKAYVEDSISIEVIEPNWHIQEESNLANGQQLFNAKCATCHQIHYQGTGPKLFDVRRKWTNDGANPELIYQWVQNWNDAAKSSDYARQVANWSHTAMNTFPDLSKEQINSIFNWIDGQGDLASAATEQATTIDYISPSKVLAIWKREFNNTNLATRAFEQRMRAIHGTCNDEVLEKYTCSLDKNISDIDKEVLAMGYSQFESFAAENLGKIELNNAHLKRLQSFYDQSVKKLKKRNERIQNKERKRQENWDKEIAKEHQDEITRTTNRNATALIEEYNFNMENVKKQIGPSVGFTLKHGGGTIVNIDKYVMDATIARETKAITDPFSGKTATITYNDFTFEVPESNKYIKLYAYVFPHQLNSYQRIDGVNGKFDYPLNDDIIYDIGVVGITEEGYEYFQKQTFKSGELGEIDMESVTEIQLEASIDQLNKKRIKKPMRIKQELKWLLKERIDFIEQKNRQKMWQFRKKVGESISNCIQNYMN